MLQLYNTLTRNKEQFKPNKHEEVQIYTCGPTVYNYAHIGNLRTYIFEDILIRTLQANDYNIKRVMNITDVGHLTDDADSGEDKIEEGARREGKRAEEIAEFYEDAFRLDLGKLNIIEPDIWARATDNIAEQIEMVQKLLENGYAYESPDGIYFDSTKVPDYGKLANLAEQKIEPGTRVDLGFKHDPHDFALWKFSKPEESRQMEWEAFGKKGFPGWHIECSAMAIKYLGDKLDIHCGGVDHIPIHHTNEIAQSEAYTNKKPWVKYWMHGEFLVLDKEKMAKSGDNFVTLKTLADKGINPLSYRYFVLQAHYRKQLKFTWDALKAAQTGLKKLKNQVKGIKPDTKTDSLLVEDFNKAINDDLNTPEALAILWKGLKEDKLELDDVMKFDKILGLELHELKQEDISIPLEVQELLNKRSQARIDRDWRLADSIRDEIRDLGYSVEDTNNNQVVKRIN